MKPVEVYVAATGNAFMTDIATWLVEAAGQAGRSARLVTSGLPHDPDAINLAVAPHELYTLGGFSDAEVNEAALVAVPVCTEQPRTPWFWIGQSACRHSPLTLDINPQGVAALRRHGVAAERLALGGVPGMVADPGERDLDVLFLGGDTPRRRRVLAGLAPALAERRSELRLFRFATPALTGTPGLVFGRAKYELLARSRLLVNLHRDDGGPGYFEWARMVEAMANGCVVVTEPSTGYEPLVAGRHFVETTDPRRTVAELLGDPARCDAIGAAAAAEVLGPLALTSALRPILDRLDATDVGAHAAAHRRAARANKLVRARPRLLPDFRPAVAIRQRVFHAILDEQRLRRRIERARCRLRFDSSDHVTEHESPAYAAAVARGDVPEVSVVVTLHNYAGLVPETLDSIVASRDVDHEVVVVDDHSTDDGRAVVEDFAGRHPETALLLLGRDANAGLAAARNLGVARARAAKIMVVDADNLVNPWCLRRLSDALDEHPAAAFAYATLEAFGSDPGLRSHLAWHPPWLCAGNYIDAQAMVRRTTFERFGGYRDDDDLVYGWEDWDLWLRLAAAGQHGIHLPEMLGRYRTQPASMISVTNLAADVTRHAIAARYPQLPWSAGD